MWSSLSFYAGKRKEAKLSTVEIFLVSGKMGGMESRWLQRMKTNSITND
jgi:hypothetical protein